MWQLQWKLREAAYSRPLSWRGFRRLRFLCLSMYVNWQVSCVCVCVCVNSKRYSWRPTGESGLPNRVSTKKTMHTAENRSGPTNWLAPFAPPRQPVLKDEPRHGYAWVLREFRVVAGRVHVMNRKRFYQEHVWMCTCVGWMRPRELQHLINPPFWLGRA